MDTTAVAISRRIIGLQAESRVVSRNGLFTEPLFPQEAAKIEEGINSHLFLCWDITVPLIRPSPFENLLDNRILFAEFRPEFPHCREVFILVIPHKIPDACFCSS